MAGDVYVILMYEAFGDGPMLLDGWQEKKMQLTFALHLN